MRFTDRKARAQENDPAVATVFTGWAVSALGQLRKSHDPLELVLSATHRHRLGADWRMVSKSRKHPSAGITMLGIVCLDARLVLNPLIMLNEFRCDAIWQIGRHMIEYS